LLLAIAGVAGAAVWLTAEWQMPYQGFAHEGVFVEITRGMPTRAIAQRMAENGVVRSRIAFEALCRWKAAPLQAGEYFFDRPATPMEVFRKLASGRVFVHVVTVPEGKTMLEIADLMEREGLTSRKEFLAAASDQTLVRDLAPKARNLEGFLFPATYQFPRHVSAERIVDSMVKRFREVWDRIEKEPGAASDSPAAAVTMASLVEKETKITEERPLVSGVFHNRLKRGMALQCDPTVIYALELTNQYSGSLTAKDLALKSPYNTYRVRGLPPGPIANPGEASLRAALHPANVEFLYFVSNSQGGHVFSRTLAEHNDNVARYRHQQAQTKAAASPNSGGDAAAKRKPR
jgi:peptidoglycan lytic transglycosylase G